MTEIIVAIITGLFGLLCAVVTALVSSRRTKNGITETFKVFQAVTDTKLQSLTEEVRLHNNYARRMPVVEEQIKVINHRVSDLEEFHKGGR